MASDQIFFYLNGKEVFVSNDEAFLPLSSYLRYISMQTGTKVVCAEGDCGACSVLINYPVFEKDFKVANSCIIPVYLLNGASVVTVEGMSQGGELSEVQKKMMDCHGSQCGFCTPGFVVTMQSMCENTKTITPEKVKNYTTGNLCRCTGYQQIIEAGTSIDLKKVTPSKKKYLTPKIQSELKKVSKKSIVIRAEKKVAYLPAKISEVSKILLKNKGVRIISSGTDLGVQHNKERIDLDQVISLHQIPELYELKVVKNDIKIGSRINLSLLQKFLENKIPDFSNFLNIFASLQIRNVATLVGNVANASPIGDTIPVLFVLDAKIEVMGARGKRMIPISDFYLGYKKINLKKGEWIKAIILPKLKKKDKLSLFKISNRRDLDISTVNAGFLYNIENKKIKDIKIAFGGIGPVTKRLYKTEAFLKGKSFIDAEINFANNILQDEITPISDVRGSEAYRRRVSKNLLTRFYHDGSMAHE